ncbi:RagB/SusD family nutrient uptake outer membrane protein [Massilibacteroides vaginae]|uniref:RagB/SusD family nutrient uptake outer membrane protein n=1 Tax=Massilibacteroides vaginae TaxID=1673718 RepID=UPI000A1CD090|nr:RagB/SusD family nutrient uptake outer membrane protein [Massilibacteroides vaginae]
MKGAIFTIILFIFFMSCDKDESKDIVRPVSKENIQGKTEKGPFVTGSKVTLYELDAQLRQTGKNIFTTETTDDIGSFTFDSKMELSSQFVEVEINGYFFNEYKNSLSDSQIKLNAITDVSGRNKINVNILTHLEYKRIKKLVAGGVNFSNAKKQAKTELLKSFRINEEFQNPEDISFFDGTNASTALLAISAILLEGKKESEFSQFISMISNNFSENGTIDNKELIDEIKYSSNNVNQTDVKNNLVKYYKEKGHTLNIGELWKYIDYNGDGILDEDDLNISPNGSLTPESFFDKEENTNAIITSLYSNAFAYYQSIIFLDAVRSNNKDSDIKNLINPYNDNISKAYVNGYRTISGCNNIIEGLESLSSNYPPDYDINPYLATAKGFRALLYVDLVQHWGDMPFITQRPTMDNLYIPRIDKETIYTFLEKDLKGVKDHLPNEVYNYANPFLPASLIDAILATIALERGKDASVYLDNIINCGIYKLESKSVDIYNTLNAETIFGLRTEQSEVPFSTDFKKGIYHPIIRYSGVFLKYAETALKKGDTSNAIGFINTVRSAKGLTVISSGSDVAKSIANTWKDIYGQDYGYFVLLKRLNLAIKELGISSHMQLLPIPGRELNLNPEMTQNPGYTF